MRSRALLLLIFAVAAGLRFADLESTLPGLNVDEAANAWNAWCLLHTGRDQTGASWPIFYFHTIGDNRTPLFIYLLLPFQTLLGLSIWSSRVTNACFGMLFVAICWWLAARLWDRRVGLWAAGIAAVLPWSVLLSRWGHEGSISGLLCALPLWGLLWSSVLRRTNVSPTSINSARAPGLWRAPLAGLLAGIACYGYPCVRIFIPLWLLLIAPLWLSAVRTAEMRRRAALWLGGFLIAFTPLIWQHLAHPEQISRRAAALWAWSAGDPFVKRVGIVAERYAEHFLPRFLFQNGDEYPESWQPGIGVMGMALAPLLIGGLIALIRACRRRSESSSELSWNRATAIALLAWLAAYPVADSLSKHVSPHAMRAMPGAGVFVLLAALGARRLFAALAERRMFAHAAALASFLILVGGIDLARLVQVEFVDRPRSPLIRQYLQADLVEVGNWLRPRLNELTRVDISMTDANLPYIVLLVALRYDPHAWLNDAREIEPGEQWDAVYSFGRIHFLVNADARSAWRAASLAPEERRAVIARRYELPDVVPVFAANSSSDALCVFESRAANR